MLRSLNLLNNDNIKIVFLAINNETIELRKIVKADIGSKLIYNFLLLEI
jgi:hypothetical protein